MHRNATCLTLLHFSHIWHVLLCVLSRRAQARAVVSWPAHQFQEEIFKIPALKDRIVQAAFMDQFSFINDSDAGAYLFCNFQDVCRNEDCSSVFHVTFEKILDFSLHYRIQVNNCLLYTSDAA